jgi:FkbM family methyltransferase
MNDTVLRSAFIDSAHFLVRCLRYRFRTEKLQIKTMMRLQLRGATVLDIGANKGIYCFWMMRAVGPSGRVIAFEPQPEMRDGIERHKSRFDWRNLRVINVALSNSDGSMNLSRQRIGDGSATLELTRRRSTDATLDVQVTRLDAMPSETFPDLKFIKCDVEGHELNVFFGRRTDHSTPPASRAIRKHGDRSKNTADLSVFPRPRILRRAAVGEQVPALRQSRCRSTLQVRDGGSPGLSVFPAGGHGKHDPV